MYVYHGASLSSLLTDPILQAANYLDIKALLDVGCKTVANMIKGKSPEEIRKTFNIQNDFTPEEEDQIRRENEWAEEYVTSLDLASNPLLTQTSSFQSLKSSYSQSNNPICDCCSDEVTWRFWSSTIVMKGR